MTDERRRKSRHNRFLLSRSLKDSPHSNLQLASTPPLIEKQKLSPFPLMTNEHFPMSNGRTRSRPSVPRSSFNSANRCAKPGDDGLYHCSSTSRPFVRRFVDTRGILYWPAWHSTSGKWPIKHMAVMSRVHVGICRCRCHETTAALASAADGRLQRAFRTRWKEIVIPSISRREVRNFQCQQSIKIQSRSSLGIGHRES